MLTRGIRGFAPVIGAVAMGLSAALAASPAQALTINWSFISDSPGVQSGTWSGRVLNVTDGVNDVSDLEVVFDSGPYDLSGQTLTDAYYGSAANELVVDGEDILSLYIHFGTPSTVLRLTLQPSSAPTQLQFYSGGLREYATVNDSSVSYSVVSDAVVPLPGAAALLPMGLAALGLFARRRKV